MGECVRMILAIDLETYSELDIKKVGLYRYAENSEILLFAYAFDDEPAQVADIIGGEPLPFEVLEAMQDKEVLKVAYNAAFERVVLNHHYPTMGVSEPSQWFCTMVQGFTLGLPGGLDKVGKALGIEEDKQKLATGKKLIQYFSRPCRPTKVNGGRTRNRPQHDTEKWDMFKEYCRQDVEAERAIRKRLEKFYPIASERQLWALDQRINDNGVLLDNDVIDGALQIDTEMKYQLSNEVIKLTGVENPNSLPQITGWIRQKQPELKFDAFDKAARAELLKRDDLLPEVRKVIEIKNLLSKTSCKKYQAMKDMKCSDGRVHGMLQFYGASRTGRWCLTGDHEVLTDSGWVRLDEWKGGKIACWNHTNEIVSFAIAKQVAFDYEGEMYSIKTQRCEQLSTPDHKMPYLDKEGTWRGDVISKVASKRFHIPFYGYKASNANSIDGNMLRVLIMTQADGHYTEDGVRYHFKKKRKVDRCKMLLRKAEIPFSVRHNGDGSTVFYVPRRHEPLPLRMFENKIFDMWLLNESADVVFDELQYWDCSSSSKNTVQYVTCNKNNADLIQALAVMSGRSATMLTKFRNNEKWSTAYVVNIWNNAGKSHTVRIENVSKENYRGKVYCAETKTGYFLVRRNGKVWVTGNSGRGVQVQNLPQNHLDDLDDARSIVKSKSYETLDLLYDSPADVLSQLIRTAFVAPVNHRFIVADFSAIEARVIAWLADEKWRMQVFADGGDIYCASASQMFHVPVEKHGINGHLRQKGKVAELACGYGGGVNALKAFGADKMGMTQQEMDTTIKQWREASPHICKLWRSVEDGVKKAIRTKMVIVGDKGIKYKYYAPWLFIKLPSGRKLAYYKPRIEQEEGFGERITYEGVMLAGGWGRNYTWGGKLVENLVQGIARDCLAVSMLRLAKAGYKIVMHVHDEVILEEPYGTGSLENACAIMGQAIDWAPGLLLRADGYETEYYKKD